MATIDVHVPASLGVTAAADGSAVFTLPEGVTTVTLAPEAVAALRDALTPSTTNANGPSQPVNTVAAEGALVPPPEGVTQ